VPRGCTTRKGKKDRKRDDSSSNKKETFSAAEVRGGAVEYMWFLMGFVFGRSRKRDRLFFVVTFPLTESRKH
jgi:hypothetical protein